MPPAQQHQYQRYRIQQTEHCPNSIDTFLTDVAHRFSSILPTGVEPVKVNLATSGCWVNTLAIPLESLPTTTLNTPAGVPARSSSSAMANAESDVKVAGRTTKVKHAAKAAAAFLAIIALGKFHGVMEVTKPRADIDQTKSKNFYLIAL
jgi:hypothetical protein